MEHSKKSLLFMAFTVLLALFIVEFLFFRTFNPNVSAVETAGQIGVYWDQKCVLRVQSINWGVLSPGNVKYITLYAKNEGNEPSLLYVTVTNWNPQDASKYLSFSWRSGTRKLGVGQITEVRQKLSVSLLITGITNFSFDIVFTGITYSQGDINNDGVVNILDSIFLSKAFGSKPTDPNWNPRADVNTDGTVNMLDAMILSAIIAYFQ